MNIGKADRYITILRTDNSERNFAGEAIEGFSALTSSWAKRIYIPGSEQTQADQMVGIQNCVYEIRYFEGIDQTMIIHDKIDNSMWNIISLEEAERKDYLRLVCFKRDNK